MNNVEDDVIESVFSEHWGKLAALLSEQAAKAVETHLASQPIATPRATPTQTPRTGTSDEYNLEVSQDLDKTGDNSNEIEKENEVEGGTVVAKDNSQFGKKEYWEERFAIEEQYDWLLTFEQVKATLLPYLEDEAYGGKEAKILLVGVGNSTFSADLYDAGYTNLTNIDYSHNVINNMEKQHKELRPLMQWRCMDMTALTFTEDECFDIIIDKAAMDAIMVDEKDVWEPREEVIINADKCCQCNRQIMKPTSLYLMISFMQPHFRTKYLMGVHADRLQASTMTEGEENEEKEALLHARVGMGQTLTGLSRRYGWRVDVEEVVTDAASLGNYLFVMKLGSE